MRREEILLTPGLWERKTLNHERGAVMLLAAVPSPSVLLCLVNAPSELGTTSLLGRALSPSSSWA